MHDIGYPIKIINDVPVITTPDEIDLTTADELRMAVLRAATHGHTTVVVDMTGTRFCDSAGFNVLVRAHKRALADGGELRLVIPADSAVCRVFTVIRLHRFIPRFDTLDQAGTGPEEASWPRPGRRKPPGATSRRPGRRKAPGRTARRSRGAPRA